MKKKLLVFLSLLTMASLTACTIKIGDNVTASTSEDTTTTTEIEEVGETTETTEEALPDEDPVEEETTETTEEEEDIEEEDMAEEDIEEDEDVVEEDDIEYEAESFFTYIPFGEYTNVVYVTSTEEFFDAIADDTLIVVGSGIYNITAYREDNPRFKNRKVKYSEYDGTIISKIKHLGIYAEQGSTLCQFVEESSEDSVLIFDNCKDLTINGIVFGHTYIDELACSGDVLEFRKCSEISLQSLNLYGCGTYGIRASKSDTLSVSRCWIHDCTNGLIDFTEVKNAYFGGCVMSYSGPYTILDLDENSDALFELCTFVGNNGYCMLGEDGHYTFNACTFHDNICETGIDDIDCTCDDNCVFDEFEQAMSVG